MAANRLDFPKQQQFPQQLVRAIQKSPDLVFVVSHQVAPLNQALLQGSALQLISHRYFLGKVIHLQAAPLSELPQQQHVPSH